jgi:hypothetical protein
MPQIFHRSFNVISRLSIFGAVFFLAALGWVGAKWVRSSYYTGAFTAVPQPVPFSHKHHVGDLKIDCRYCHTAVEDSAFGGMPTTKTCMNCHSQIWVGAPLLAPVRESYASGRPLFWNRVHRLPDFTYFNHSIHIKKGIGCVSCHGRVDRMPLTWQVHTLQMDWCIECHRNPERHVRPREEIFNLAWERPTDPDQLRHLGARLGLNPIPETPEAFGESLKKAYRIRDARQLTSCSVCHR